MELHDIVLPRSERWLCSWMSHPQLTSKGVSYCTCKIRQSYSSLKTTWPARCTEWEACRYRLDTECLPQTLRIQPLGPAHWGGYSGWLGHWRKASKHSGPSDICFLFFIPTCVCHTAQHRLTIPSPRGLVVTLKPWAPDKSFPEYLCQVFCHSCEKSNIHSELSDVDSPPSNC